jgi:hypothetical protein
MCCARRARGDGRIGVVGLEGGVESCIVRVHGRAFGTLAQGKSLLCLAGQL